MAENRSALIVVDRKFIVKNAEDVFYKYKAEIIEDLRQKLIEKDKDQPGVLIQSIDVQIFEKGAKLTFELEMEDYWKFVDKGVDGTKESHGSEYKFKNGNKPVNLGAMLDFIKVRGIKPKQSAKKLKQVQSTKNKTVKKAVKQVNRDRALKSAAFAMGLHMKRQGIKPTHFFTEVITEELKSRMAFDLEKALGKDIEIDIKAAFK